MRDPELDELRAKVDCRTVLERDGWKLDAPESTTHAVKFRNGPAQIIIVTHEGRGWFDPINDQRGDVLALAQRLTGGNFGHARRALRPLAGIAPTLTPTFRDRSQVAPLDAEKTWSRAPALQPGSQAWRYLSGERGLPAATIARANDAGLLREGIYGTAWFLHRLADDAPAGWEMRGPKYKGFAKGGDKALFWIGQIREARRVAVTESAIDALSLATIEQWPEGTAYVSTGGGFGPPTAETFSRLLPSSCRLVAATDRGQGGDILAERLRELAAKSCAGFGRVRSSAKDWNDELRGRIE